MTATTQDITTSVKIESSTTAEDFKRWLKSVPDGARLSVSVTPGDRPWESGEQKITARWTQEVDG